MLSTWFRLHGAVPGRRALLLGWLRHDADNLLSLRQHRQAADAPFCHDGPCDIRFVVLIAEEMPLPHGLPDAYFVRIPMQSHDSYDEIVRSHHADEVLAITDGERAYVERFHLLSSFRRGSVGGDHFRSRNHDFFE